MLAWKRLAVVSGLCWFPQLALACPGKDDAQAHASTVTADEPAAVARSGKLIGSNCSYRTGVMARRVLSEGDDYAYVGTLDRFANDLDTGVACPFRLGIDGTTYVIANELVDSIMSANLLDAELSLQGKMMEVDGRRYVVLTSYRPANT